MHFQIMVCVRMDNAYMYTHICNCIMQMDKASIIGDAIVYVQSLKDEAKKLSDDISILESSPTSKDDQIFLRVPIDNMGVKQTEQYHYKKKQCGGKIYTECDGS
ncbi:uncharacterized protein A4U43_C02F4500 [Asparagus officinalis]|uniref:BHLH domain-containing protein n=1 Tax=Asparagus officinalis TaxID=4686 RepID=A0A5P1FFV2_ASPOF|nr:uncharacterized protein A4U43_C02F4500 [Asparagus officinalis]